MITDHKYDAGWPRDDSKGCIASLVSIAPGGAHTCGQPGSAHQYSEYDTPKPFSLMSRITDPLWRLIRVDPRRKHRGWLGRLLDLHSPTGHVIGDCWCVALGRGGAASNGRSSSEAE